jgi:hypothetical protein
MRSRSSTSRSTRRPRPAGARTAPTVALAVRSLPSLPPLVLQCLALRILIFILLAGLTPSLILAYIRNPCHVEMILTEEAETVAKPSAPAAAKVAAIAQ